ncbi:MAG: undecaprenyl-diphosphate phosphatase [Ruminococcaceae bacterium]|nr:undecaprenyl-diphosphate phosphatase [Oscillospiraceae bacterium]
MKELFELIKVLLLGILEGVTEWLPISSTGHLLLFDNLLYLDESNAFKEVFFVVIQLGAILAVLVHFWGKMVPAKQDQIPETLSLWTKVALACIPGAIFTLLFDDALEAFLNGTKIGRISLMTAVIATALILYGIWFLFIEKKRRPSRIHTLQEISCKDALCIGVFQTLSILPGTSRSGATVIGALSLGIERSVAAEFSFFLAVPVMLGYSALKLIKFGFAFTPYQLRLLLIGTVSAFITSLFVIRFLLSYVKKHSFASFGVYRILLGIAVFFFCLL